MKKNLRKALVMVLVLAMVFSIGAIGASAAFTDTATSKYKSAIDVMTGIGVFNGTDSGNFDPAGSLTREQAAKIIAYMLLGPTNAAMISNASSSKFADVAASRWSAGYIEYCANLGIIGGDGTGNFNPTGTLTTAAFTKMLLVALGYKADEAGLSGTSSWANNAASLALSAGVYDSGIVISATTNCTREQACQLAFKALAATLVQYTGGSSLTVGGTTITTGATRSNVTCDNTVAGYNGATDGLMQFCEKYFPNLKVTVAPDDFGRPGAATWRNGAAVVGVVLPKLTKSYTTSVASSTIYADLGLSSVVTANTFTDGSNNTGTFSVDGTSANRIGGNGTLTEVYYNTNTGAVTIVVINTYYGTVSSVTAATSGIAAYVTIGAGATTLGSFASGNFTTSGLAAGTPIYYTVAQTAASTYVVKSVAAATKATVTATQYSGTVSFVAGGTTYSYSAKNNNNVTIADFAPHDVYLDSYGYVINVTGTTAVTNYAVVVATGTSSDGLGGTNYNAKLLFTDGTTKVVGVKSPTGAPLTAMAGSIVNYTVSATNNLYTLTDVTTTDYASAQAIALTSGQSNLVWGTVPTTFYGNSNTIFLVHTAPSGVDTYTLYTGIANVPTLSGTSSGQVYSDATGFARIVYVDGATVAAATNATVYLTGTYSVTAEPTTGTYYICNAVVDGKPQTVKLDAVPTKGLYTGITYNSLNIGTIGASATQFTATGTTAAANGVVGLGSNTYFSYTSDCAVYYISLTGSGTTKGVAAEKTGITSVLTDLTDTVVYTKTLTGVVNAIYIQIV